jgi:hypothetical protein
MNKLFLHRLLAPCLGLLLSLGAWAIAPPAIAYDNPALLPQAPTAVIDLANSFTDSQELILNEDLEVFEQETGWKLRVLTQFDQTPGRAVKEFWGLNDKSVLLVSDSGAGNILNFNVGDAAYQLLPRTFWIELQTRFGNQYFVRDNGEDQSILQSLDSIKVCLRQGGCNVVPGLPQEQWLFTLMTSIVGGIICGFAGHPRKSDQAFSWQWALIFSPLWGILFISFGIAPVITRTSDWLPLVRNIGGFAIGCIGAYLIPMSQLAPSSDT